MTTILATGIAAGLATISFASNKISASSHMALQASYAAEGAIDQVKAWILSTPYDSVGHVWMMANSLPGPVVDPEDATLPLAGDSPVDWDASPSVVKDRISVGSGATSINVKVWLYSWDLSHARYRVIAQSTVGGITTTLAQDILARDTFARWVSFQGEGNVNIKGGTIIRGKVHGNREIFVFGGGATFTDDVSCQYGFYYQDGANDANTTFLAGKIGNADPIVMPSVGEITNRRTQASGNYDVHDNISPVDAEIEFLGDQVRIKAIYRNTGIVKSDTLNDLPTNGVIYVQGDVRSVKGRVRGSTTIATTNEIKITGNLVYEDTQGNPAYLLTKAGEPVPGNNTPDGVAWTAAAGYDYIPNPEYRPTTPPIVGLMAGKKIEVTDAAPYNMELHAAIFSLDENWSVDTTSNVKGNFRFLGAMATRHAGGRSSRNSNDGYSLSGEYIYDTNLRTSPPPQWLIVSQPFWGPRWKM
jgi:hypothetical protein